ncbi:MAG: DNA-3-methyladenine glycosylase [Actinomycetota bacterium]
MPSSEVPPRLGAWFFARPVEVVAPDLLGCLLVHDGVGGVIVEVERYQEDDPASHSFRGPTPRARVMFGPPGHAYVYRSYGMHWCMNVVCDAEGTGSAVLIRALAPTRGVEVMRGRRPGVPDRRLCAGPGRLTRALAIDDRVNGTSLLHGAVSLHERRDPVDVVCGPRIGVSRAADRPWRLGVAGSPFVSRPFPAAMVAA